MINHFFEVRLETLYVETKQKNTSQRLADWYYNVDYFL